MAKMGMGDIMKQAQKMQEKMQKIQEELADLQVEASSGGGMVTVVGNGKQEVPKSVHLNFISYGLY